MANFDDVHQNLVPQLKAVTVASSSLKNSAKFKRFLEVSTDGPAHDRSSFTLQIVLAFGNYMNSSKRGPVYGFKLASLEIVSAPNGNDRCWNSSSFRLAHGYPNA